MTLTMPLHTHVCSSPSRALGAGVACPPYALKTHISSPPSPLSSGPGIPIERRTGKSATSSPEQPPICSCVSGSPPLIGGEGEKSHGI